MPRCRPVVFLTSPSALMFVVLLIVQGFVFAQYPRKYFDNKWCNLIVVLVLPPLVLFVYIKSKLRPSEALRKLWMVWLLYVDLLLIPMVILIWGIVVPKNDTDSFFGVSILKITVCVSPMLAFLLLITVSDPRLHRDLIGRLSGSVTLELFDYIGMLEMLLASSKPSKTLPSAFRWFIISATCFNLFLTPLEMLENKSLTHPRSRKRKLCDLILVILQMLVVNITLLVIRLVMWLYYNHEVSIFVAKNVIVLGICFLEILKICECCGYKPAHFYSRVQDEIQDEDEDDVV